MKKIQRKILIILQIESQMELKLYQKTKNNEKNHNNDNLDQIIILFKKLRL